MSTVVVLDTNELQRDWMCTGLIYQLLYYIDPSYPWNVQIRVPAVVVEELAANRDRAFEELRREFQRTRDKSKSMGFDSEPLILKDHGYREYLLERFDVDLGIEVMDWPDVKHEDLARRAVNRIPPFNDKGTGYRDSLVWADVLQLAAAGIDVALVTRDKVFADGEDLAPTLREEVEQLPGSVELVTDFGKWLLAHVPWKVDNLPDAVALVRRDHFGSWFNQSDFVSELLPQTHELGFEGHASSVEVDFSEATDGLCLIGSREDRAEEATVVTYDLPVTVYFDATFPGERDFPGDWEIQPGTDLDGFRVHGNVPMIVRLSVRYEKETWYVDRADFRRIQRNPFGEPPVGTIDTNQVPLFPTET